VSEATLFDIEDPNCSTCGRLLIDGECRWCVSIKRNLDDGRKRKQRGMKQALQPDALADWKDAFYKAAERLGRSGDAFTSEDVLEIVGLPTGEIGQHANNAVGAMMNALARRGVIRKTGRHVPSKRPSSHGTEINEWVGVHRALESHDPVSSSPVPVPSPAPCRECGTTTCSRRPGYPYCYGAR